MVKAEAPAHPLCTSSGPAAGKNAASGAGICFEIETVGPDGRSRDMRAGPPTAPGYFEEKLTAADFVLLGEVHDNPLHHRERARLLARLGGGIWRQGEKGDGAPRPVAGVVLEHVRLDQQSAVDGVLARRADILRIASSDVFDALQWEKSGWPDRKSFEPIIRTALDLGLPIYAGNPEREELRNVARGGIAALPEAKVKEFDLAVSLPEAGQEALLGELEASHCGLMPRQAFTGMADAQRYRDAFMARALLAAQREHRHAILLAGNGHVRRDRGVPWHLKRMAPARNVVSFLYVEVDPALTKVEDYVERDAAGRPIADFVVVTAGVERPDPCEAMRKRFKR